MAGWTTATPNIYRAALSFATFFPRWSLRRLSFFVGAIIAVCACFPAVMRIDWVANIAALIVPPVGAICLVEHWIFPKIGLVRHWNLYRGRAVNPAGLLAWGLSSAFALCGALGHWMHPFFLPLPTFLLAGIAYPVFALLLGARQAVPEETRRAVDAVEARVAELAEEEQSSATSRGDAKPGANLRSGLTFGLSLVALAALVLTAMGVALGYVTPESFKHTACPCTILYFVFICLSDFLKRRGNSRG